jgi:hypothetical protein
MTNKLMKLQFTQQSVIALETISLQSAVSFWFGLVCAKVFLGLRHQTHWSEVAQMVWPQKCLMSSAAKFHHTFIPNYHSYCCIIRESVPFICIQ